MALTVGGFALVLLVLAVLFFAVGLLGGGAPERAAFSTPPNPETRITDCGRRGAQGPLSPLGRLGVFRAHL